VKTEILSRLSAIEAEHSVRILYAVESGSRAWGFESTDSDWDVRFIYVHELPWYLSVQPGRDVIEYPVVDLLDFSGWDLRKTLQLMSKSNPMLFEWLRSPIVYRKLEKEFNVIEEASRDWFSPIKAVYHYLHMARGNFREYLQGDQVKIKKYFYVLRPLLACRWIEAHGESPPLPFEDLLDDAKLTPMLEMAIRDLLLRKRSGFEFGFEPAVPVIGEFIEGEIRHFEEAAGTMSDGGRPDGTALDEALRHIVLGRK